MTRASLHAADRRGWLARRRGRGITLLVVSLAASLCCIPRRPLPSFVPPCPSWAGPATTASLSPSAEAEAQEQARQDLPYGMLSLTSDRFLRLTDVGTKVDGGLKRTMVRRILRAHYPRFLVCWDTVKQPSAEATFVVTFQVGENGTPTNVAFGGTLASDAKFKACMQRSMPHSTFAFPPPEGGRAQVEMVLSFEADGS